jgi:NADH-quinone oxidoreductase subunit M
MISLLLIFILISLFFLLIFRKNYLIIRNIGILTSGSLFFFSLLFTIFFNIQIFKFQFKETYTFFIFEKFLNFNLSFGLDHLSLLFFVLTTFLLFLCVLYVINDIENNKIYFYIFNLILLEFLLIIIFFSLDILIFYIAFESVLIPMFFLTGIFGSRERKTWAIYLLIFYTICGSLLMLLGILYLYSLTNTFSIETYIATLSLNENIQNYLWIFFALSFLSKIPIFPLHIWLPEAHVEAPTVGSVVLAGILLKLGVYGLIRFNLNLFPLSSLFFSPYLLVLCSLGVIFASLCAISQSDLKRIIAYSSIAHMNLVVIGIFCQNSLGLSGAIFQSISHGFVSSGLFFLIGFLYSRYHSRAVQYYSGLVQILPLFSLFFIFFSLSNIALPSTSAFIGELFIILGSFIYNEFLTYVIIASVVLCAIYSLWLSNRILFGNLGIFLYSASDLNKIEFLIIFSLFFFIVLLGIFPFVLMDYIQTISSIILLRTNSFFLI